MLSVQHDWKGFYIYIDIPFTEKRKGIGYMRPELGDKLE